MKNDEITSDILTVTEVAEYLKVNEDTVYRLLRENRLRGVRIPGPKGNPGIWRIRRSDVLEFLDANQ